MHEFKRPASEMTRNDRSYIHRAGRVGHEKKRDILKADLLAASPYCCHCGIELSHSTLNKPHLIRDRLSCPAHVREVREVCKLEDAQRLEAALDDRIEITAAGRIAIDASCETEAA